MSDNQIYEEIFIQRGQEVVEKLRALADRVERELNDETEPAIMRAAGIISEVQWGIANLRLDSLVRAAYRIIEAKMESSSD